MTLRTLVRITATAFAKLRTIWLQPGAYNLELRSGDRAFKQRNVLSGKTLELQPRLVKAVLTTEEKLK